MKTEHQIEDVAFKQLETAWRLYCDDEKPDYYSVITLAGAADEIFKNLLLEVIS